MKSYNNYKTTKTLFYLFTLFNLPSLISGQNSDVCAIEPSFNTPISSNEYLSRCPLGYTFPNKHADYFNPQKKDLFLKFKKKLEILRKTTENYQQALEDQIRQMIWDLRDHYYKNLSDETLNTWGNYLIALSHVSTNANILIKEEFGFCGEASYTSIALSLINQIQTGKRENIQLIIISGKFANKKEKKLLIIIITLHY